MAQHTVVIAAIVWLCAGYKQLHSLSRGTCPFSARVTLSSWLHHCMCINRTLDFDKQWLWHDNVVCALRVHPLSSPCPTILLTQNPAQKGIAGSDIMKLKVSW